MGQRITEVRAKKKKKNTGHNGKSFQSKTGNESPRSHTGQMVTERELSEKWTSVLLWGFPGGAGDGGMEGGKGAKEDTDWICLWEEGSSS